jgi:hypothetical protein
MISIPIPAKLPVSKWYTTLLKSDLRKFDFTLQLEWNLFRVHPILHLQNRIYKFTWSLRRICTVFYESFGLKRPGSWVGYQTTTLPLPRLPASDHWTPALLAACATIWSDWPSVASIGPITELCAIVTFVTTVFGCDRRLNNQRSAHRMLKETILLPPCTGDGSGCPSIT